MRLEPLIAKLFYIDERGEGRDKVYSTTMNCDYVLQYLEKTEVPIVSKKNHDIIMCGLEKMIFLKEGVVKVSSILEDGREYNITYAKGPNLLSLMCDTLREDVAYRIRIRVESEEASFCGNPQLDRVD